MIELQSSRNSKFGLETNESVCQIFKNVITFEVMSMFVLFLTQWLYLCTTGVTIVYLLFLRSVKTIGITRRSIVAIYFIKKYVSILLRISIN